LGIFGPDYAARYAGGGGMLFRPIGYHRIAAGKRAGHATAARAVGGNYQYPSNNLLLFLGIGQQ